MPKLTDVHRARKQRHSQPKIEFPGQPERAHERLHDLRRIGGGHFFGAPVRLSHLGAGRT